MMNREFKKLASDVQMSEAFITSIFLALSGGFQDAYTYFTRDEVFSNAQTGNVVLMSTHLMMGEWMQGIKYLFPLLAFAGGVFFAERLQAKYKYAKKDPNNYAVMTTYGSMDSAMRYAEAKHLEYTDSRYANQNPCTTVYRLVRQLLGKDEGLNNELISKIDEN